MMRLRLHEYQAAQLMHRYRIPIPRGNVAYTAEEAVATAKAFGDDVDNKKFLIKA